MMRKRVLIFSVAYHPFVGGAEVAVKEITDRLPDIEFHMLTLNTDGRQKREEQLGNVCVHRIGRGTFGKFTFPFRGYREALCLHERNKYSAFWSIMANQASIAAAFTKKSFPSVPLILAVQEGDEESHLKRYVLGNDLLYRMLIRPWHTLVFKRADIITAISSSLAARAAKINPRVPTAIIPNGVDLDLFARKSNSEHIEDVKREMGISPGDCVLITVSRLALKNAVGDIVSALPLLPEHVKLVVLGSGELENNIRAQIARLSLASRVKLLGAKPHSEIPKYLAESDIFIRPSISEGMGNSFIEAMAAGIPVIATPVGGIVDFLTDRETGVFCEVRSPASIARAVTLLIDDRALRERVISNARALVASRYDWNRIAEDFRRTVFDKLESPRPA